MRYGSTAPASTSRSPWPSSANSIVVRYSIPDNAAGTGITAPLALYAGGTKLQDLSLSSAYSWVYGEYPYGNDPAGGKPHHFFDEVRAQFPAQPAGTVLKLQKDASSTAASYVIDLVDTEQVAPALTAPAGHLSITGYGAVADDAGDDTAAINSAVAAARAQGRACGSRPARSSSTRASTSRASACAG
ncbi:hypothetical protein ACFQX6_21545 [Streptosporangium lutulentum]